ncbi:uncharacterized protein LOC143229158 isoform X2 [Tachypleus tridentatus]|uniref:uncharacterized protein LOC143229158 isoform X2 n=1 Tax=Tachypleus tridentatus TaxID=6853 RepID=UPI003FD4E98A
MISDTGMNICYGDKANIDSATCSLNLTPKGSVLKLSSEYDEPSANNVKGIDVSISGTTLTSSFMEINHKHSSTLQSESCNFQNTNFSASKAHEKREDNRQNVVYNSSLSEVNSNISKHQIDSYASALNKELVLHKMNVSQEDSQLLHLYSAQGVNEMAETSSTNLVDDHLAFERSTTPILDALGTTDSESEINEWDDTLSNITAEKLTDFSKLEEYFLCALKCNDLENKKFTSTATENVKTHSISRKNLSREILDNFDHRSKYSTEDDSMSDDSVEERSQFIFAENPYANELDLSLHTILEESCEESERESLTATPTNDMTDLQLEQYFSKAMVENKLNWHHLQDEGSEWSDTQSEKSGSTYNEVKEGIFDDVSPALLASSRLEKYFTSGLLGIEAFHYPEDAVFEVGSSSDADENISSLLRTTSTHFLFDDNRDNDEQDIRAFYADDNTYDTVKRKKENNHIISSTESTFYASSDTDLLDQDEGYSTVNSGEDNVQNIQTKKRNLGEVDLQECSTVIRQKESTEGKVDNIQSADCSLKTNIIVDTKEALTDCDIVVQRSVDLYNHNDLNKEAENMGQYYSSTDNIENLHDMEHSVNNVRTHNNNNIHCNENGRNKNSIEEDITNIRKCNCSMQNVVEQRSNAQSTNSATNWKMTDIQRYNALNVTGGDNTALCKKVLQEYNHSLPNAINAYTEQNTLYCSKFIKTNKPTFCANELLRYNSVVNSKLKLDETSHAGLVIQIRNDSLSPMSDVNIVSNKSNMQSTNVVLKPEDFSVKNNIVEKHYLIGNENNRVVRGQTEDGAGNSSLASFSSVPEDEIVETVKLPDSHDPCMFGNLYCKRGCSDGIKHIQKQNVLFNINSLQEKTQSPDIQDFLALEEHKSKFYQIRNTSENIQNEDIETTHYLTKSDEHIRNTCLAHNVNLPYSLEENDVTETLAVQDDFSKATNDEEYNNYYRKYIVPRNNTHFLATNKDMVKSMIIKIIRVLLDENSTKLVCVKHVEGLQSAWKVVLEIELRKFIERYFSSLICEDAFIENVQNSLIAKIFYELYFFRSCNVFQGVRDKTLVLSELCRKLIKTMKITGNDSRIETYISHNEVEYDTANSLVQNLRYSLLKNVGLIGVTLPYVSKIISLPGDRFYNVDSDNIYGEDREKNHPHARNELSQTMRSYNDNQTISHSLDQIFDFLEDHSQNDYPAFIPTESHFQEECFYSSPINNITVTSSVEKVNNEIGETKFITADDTLISYLDSSVISLGNNSNQEETLQIVNITQNTKKKNSNLGKNNVTSMLASNSGDFLNVKPDDDHYVKSSSPTKFHTFHGKERKVVTLQLECLKTEASPLFESHFFQTSTVKSQSEKGFSTISVNSQKKPTVSAPRTDTEVNRKLGFFENVSHEPKTFSSFIPIPCHKPDMSYSAGQDLEIKNLSLQSNSAPKNFTNRSIPSNSNTEGNLAPSNVIMFTSFSGRSAQMSHDVTDTISKPQDTDPRNTYTKTAGSLEWPRSPPTMMTIDNSTNLTSQPNTLPKKTKKKYFKHDIWLDDTKNNSLSQEGRSSLFTRFHKGILKSCSKQQKLMSSGVQRKLAVVKENLSSSNSKLQGCSDCSSSETKRQRRGGKQFHEGRDNGDFMIQTMPLPKISISQYETQHKRTSSLDMDKIEQEERIKPRTLGHHSRSLNSLTSYTSFSESMNSVYSAAGGGRHGSVIVTGDVLFSIHFSPESGILSVHVIQCRDLVAVDSKHNKSDPYVKLYLLPDRTKTGKRKTKVKKNELSPVFDEVMKVCHSQRLNEPPLKPWVASCRNGEMISSHCTCKAGIGEVCSHVAATLFYMEAVVKRHHSTACTSMPCEWIVPSRGKGHLKQVTDMDFTSVTTKKQN